MRGRIATVSRALSVLTLLFVASLTASGGGPGRLAAQAGPTIIPDPQNGTMIVGQPARALFIEAEDATDLVAYQFTLNYNGRTTLAAEALAGALLRVSEDPARAADWGHLGRKRVEALFQIGPIAERILSLYGEVWDAGASSRTFEPTRRS